MRIFELDAVDQVNPKIAVHGLITQNVHVLFCSTRHLVLTAESKNLCKAYIKEEAFHQACKNDQGFEQSLIVLGRACLEVRVCDCINERNKELILGANGRYFVIGIENF